MFHPFLIWKPKIHSNGKVFSAVPPEEEKKREAPLYVFQNFPTEFPESNRTIWPQLEIFWISWPGGKHPVS